MRLLITKWGVACTSMLLCVFSYSILEPFVARRPGIPFEQVHGLISAVCIGFVVVSVFFSPIHSGFAECKTHQMPKMQALIASVMVKANLEREFQIVMMPGLPNIAVGARFGGPCTFLVKGHIAQMMTERELEAVLAHEWAHVRAHDHVVTPIVVVAPLLLHVWTALYAVASGMIVVAVVAGYLAMLAALLASWYSRTSEFLADLSVLHFLGVDRSEDLGCALMKLEAVRFVHDPYLDMEMGTRLLSTHPTLHQRIQMLAP